MENGTKTLDAMPWIDAGLDFNVKKVTPLSCHAGCPLYTDASSVSVELEVIIKVIMEVIANTEVEQQWPPFYIQTFLNRTLKWNKDATFPPWTGCGKGACLWPWADKWKLNQKWQVS